MASGEDQPSSQIAQSPTMGKVFAIGIALLCLMVMASVAMMFWSAKQDAENRKKHPVIGQP